MIPDSRPSHPATPPPFLVVVHTRSDLDWDDPGAWDILPAYTKEGVEAVWAHHDGRSYGTDALAVFRWKPEPERPVSGAYVPHEAWTRPRP